MIALDGADSTLLERWSSDGTLPNLTALRKRGKLAELSTPAGISDDGLWASFQFGCGLGGHGRYHWQQHLRNGQIGMAFENEADREPFWNTLSQDGMRVAVFDVPKCGPARPINGIHLVDWLVHGRYFSTPQSYPQPLAAQVVEQFGPAPPSICGMEGAGLDDAETPKVLANLRTSIARKRAAACHHLRAQPWDLFIVGFKEAHCAGHHLWNFADPRHPLYDADRTARLDDPLRTVFVALDAAIGELISIAGEDAAVAVFSTTRMVPNGTLIHLMPSVVAALNRLLAASAAGHLGKRAAVLELLPYNDHAAALRLHTKRGLFGWMRGAAWRKAMLGQAKSLLLTLEDVDKGTPVLDGIDCPSSECLGPRAAWLPDLLVRYLPGSLPRAIASPLLGRFEADMPPMRPGNHASGGLLILKGAAIGGVSEFHQLSQLATRLLGASAISSLPFQRRA
jgi:hypothetical protein